MSAPQPSPSPDPRPRRARSRARGRIGVVALVVGLGATVAIAADGPADITTGATATESAVRDLPEVVDVVTLHDSGPLDDETRARAIDAANRSGSSWSVVHSVSSAMTRLSRNGATVQVPAAGYSLPMSTTFLEDDAIATLMGADVLAGLTDRTLVMSLGTAFLRGAQAGDVVTLRHVDGSTRDFTINQVVDDAITGGTELLMLPSAAARLGIERPSRVLLWGFADRDSIMTALAAAGAVENAAVGPGAVFDPPGSPSPIRLRRSWDPRDPDTTLGMAATKAVLGEFSYRVNDSGSITVDSAWKAANLVTEPLRPGFSPTLNRRCHRVVMPVLKAALAEAAARGLNGAFDFGDANIAGGCYTPRFNRLSPNSSIGFLSRHTWGMAMDINTRRDCQGCTPPSMATRAGGCEAVRIFRKYGFAWGGNFTTPDGMHFEYVGEDRSQIPYPSRWCSNQPAGGALVEAELSLEASERSVLFADAGLFGSHWHDDGHDH